MIGFPKRWHHGHSLAGGALTGAAVWGYAPYVYMGAGVLVGAGLTLLGLVGLKLGRTLLAGFEAWQADRMARSAAELREATRLVPVYGRARRRAKPAPVAHDPDTAEIPF